MGHFTWDLLSTGQFRLLNKVSERRSIRFISTTFPVLQFIKQKIGSELMFQFQSSDLERSKFKRNFYGQYGNDPFLKKLYVI